MPEQMAANNPTQPPKTPFAFLVNSKLAVEKTTTRTLVRQSHLALRNVNDPHTNQVLELLQATEETIDGWVTEELRKHPAYPWFSRIKGIGNENIAKVVGLISIERAPRISSLWRHAGMHVIKVTVTPEQQMEEAQRSLDGLQKKLAELRKKFGKNPEKEAEQVQVLRSGAINTLAQSLEARVSNLVSEERGYAPTRAMYKALETKLDYDSDLRVMCFRLAGSLIKAQGLYAQFYDRAKAGIIAKLQSKGVLIVPALELPTNGNGKIFEPVGTIAAGHVHMRAQRKMTKLFLSHLWLVWRQAVNLPITQPYAHGILNHAPAGIIDPWDMVEKPKKTPRTRKTA